MKKIDTKSIFRAIDEKRSGTISAAAIVDCLAVSGIDIGDARLASFRARLDELGDSPIDAATFESLLDSSGSLVSRVTKGELVIPEFEAFTRQLSEIFDEVKSQRDGKVADYIPQLARVSPDYFGVSVCTIDGQRFRLGERSKVVARASCSRRVSTARARRPDPAV